LISSTPISRFDRAEYLSVWQRRIASEKIAKYVHHPIFDV
jgi:hypothetical protein